MQYTKWKSDVISVRSRAEITGTSAVIGQDWVMGERLWTYGRGMIDGDTIWFVPSDYSCLCQYNYKIDKVVKFIFLEGAVGMLGTHYSLVKYMNYIILVPTRDMNVFIYDSDKEKIHRIPLKGEANAKEKFIAGAVWKHYIYMFPAVYPYVLKLNMKTMHLEYIDCASVRNCSEAGIYYTQDCVTIGSEANLLMIDSNKICEFDMETGSEQVIVVGEEGVHYKTICPYKDNGLILSDQHGNITILDEEKERINYILSAEETHFTSCIPVMEGYLFIPYGKDKQCVYWDEQKLEKFNLGVSTESTIWANTWNFSAYSRCYYDEKMAILFNISNKSLCVLDRKTLTMREKYVLLDNLDEETAKKIYNGYIEMNKSGILNERQLDVLGLRGLLNHIGMCDSGRSQLEYVGERIYSALKK